MINLNNLTIFFNIQLLAISLKLLRMTKSWLTNKWILPYLGAFRITTETVKDINFKNQTPRVLLIVNQFGAR